MNTVHCARHTRRPTYWQIVMYINTSEHSSKMWLHGGCAASFFLVLCFSFYICAGVVAIVCPPQASTTAGGVDVLDSAMCLRATRHSDYTTVDVVMGTPPQQIYLLFRPDNVLQVNDTKNAIHIFSQQVVKSSTVICEEERVCEDVFMVSHGTKSDSQTFVGRFEYSPLFSTARRISGIDGEFSLREGFAYWITATHICYTNTILIGSASRNGASAFVSSSRRLVANRNGLLTDSGMSVTPAVTSDLTTVCESEEVHLFPDEAGDETSRLSLTDVSLYNNQPQSVHNRRIIVEIGTICANHSAELARDLMIYNLDCSLYSACITHPNVPFRRVATSSIFIASHIGGEVYISTEAISTLDALPKLADSVKAFLLSLVKLLMITLAAAVVYVRSRRPTASSSWLVKHCMATASVQKQMTNDDNDVSFSITEDIVVGLLAVTARCAIALYRLPVLAQDDQLRVCVSEITASVLSALHLLLRYYGLERGQELPISKLGGSTAIMDSTAAVMMAFAEPPSLVVSLGKFDPTARMLVALLLSTIVVSRCAFSASCCGVLWGSEHRPERRMYAYIVFYSGVHWILHGVALGILMADLFVTPCAYSMSRSIPGSITEARLLLFLAFVCAGLPRFMMTILHVTSAQEHMD